MLASLPQNPWGLIKSGEPRFFLSCFSPSFPFPIWLFCVSCPPTAFYKVSLFSLPVWNYLLAPKFVRELHLLRASSRYRQCNHSFGTRPSDPHEAQPLTGTPSPYLKCTKNLKPEAVFHHCAKQASPFLRALFVCMVLKHLCFTMEPQLYSCWYSENWPAMKHLLSRGSLPGQVWKAGALKLMVM